MEGVFIAGIEENDMMRGSKGKRFYLINEDLDKVPLFLNELDHFAFLDMS